MKKITMLLLVILLVFGCSEKKPRMYSTSMSFIQAVDEHGKNIITSPFGTTIALSSNYEEKLALVKDLFKDEIKRMHQLFDKNYYYYLDGILINNIKVINDSYGEERAIKVDNDLIQIINEGIEFTKLSKGKFNIAIGSLTDFWDGYIKENANKPKSETTDPSKEEIEEALKCVPSFNDIENIVLVNNEENTITLKTLDGCQGRVSLNLGALGKSYAVNKIIENEEFKNGSFLINAGTSTIMALGQKANKENWRILIPSSSLYKNNPSEELLAISSANNFSVTTSSGDINGYYNKDGVLRHHIIDASDGYPKNYYYSISVVGPNPFYADVITTAMMNMNKQEMIEFLSVLESQNIDFGFILQSEEDNKLKVTINSELQGYIDQQFNFEVSLYES